jgi:hypothetical protein
MAILAATSVNVNPSMAQPSRADSPAPAPAPASEDNVDYADDSLEPSPEPEEATSPVARRTRSQGAPASVTSRRIAETLSHIQFPTPQQAYPRDVTIEEERNLRGEWKSPHPDADVSIQFGTPAPPTASPAAVPTHVQLDDDPYPSAALSHALHERQIDVEHVIRMGQAAVQDFDANIFTPFASAMADREKRATVYGRASAETTRVLFECRTEHDCLTTELADIYDRVERNVITENAIIRTIQIESDRISELSAALANLGPNPSAGTKQDYEDSLSISRTALESASAHLTTHKRVDSTNNLLISRALSQHVTFNQTEKTTSMMDCDLSKFCGHLKPTDLSSDKVSPKTAASFSSLLNGIMQTYPMALSAVIPGLRRVIGESQLGAFKSIPMSMFKENADPGSINGGTVPSAFYRVWVGQSKALWNLLQRKFEAALSFSLRPYPFGENKHAVQAVRGDAIMAVFILLDAHEKNGYLERQLQRDFYSYADTKIASDPSLMNAVTTLLKPMSEAQRIKTQIDYEVVIRCANELRRRDMSLHETIVPYLNRSQAWRQSTGVEHNALSELDNLLAAAATEIKRSHLDSRVAATARKVETSIESNDQRFIHAANSVLGKGWASQTGGNIDTGSTSPSNYRCAAIGCPNKLSDKIQKSTEGYMANKNVKVRDHTSICDQCFKVLQDTGKLKLHNGKERLKGAKRTKGRANKVTTKEDKSTGQADPVDEGSPPVNKSESAEFKEQLQALREQQTQMTEFMAKHSIAMRTADDQ